MIKNFVHKGLEDLYTTGKSRRVKADFIPRCILILQALDIAEDATEMNIVTFAFHSLQGKPKRYAVKVNKNYRITFGWDKGAIDVNLEDYH